MEDQGYAPAVGAGALTGAEQLAGELGGPLAGAIGSAAGEAGTERLYDHRTDIGDWMQRRAAHVAARFAHAFDRGMPPHGPTLR